MKSIELANFIYNNIIIWPKEDVTLIPNHILESDHVQLVWCGRPCHANHGGSRESDPQSFALASHIFSWYWLSIISTTRIPHHWKYQVVWKPHMWSHLTPNPPFPSCSNTATNVLAQGGRKATQLGKWGHDLLPVLQLFVTSANDSQHMHLRGHDLSRVSWDLFD